MFSLHLFMSWFFIPHQKCYYNQLPCINGKCLEITSSTCIRQDIAKFIRVLFSELSQPFVVEFFDQLGLLTLCSFHILYSGSLKFEDWGRGRNPSNYTHLTSIFILINLFVSWKSALQVQCLSFLGQYMKISHRKESHERNYSKGGQLGESTLSLDWDYEEGRVFKMIL